MGACSRCVTIALALSFIVAVPRSSAVGAITNGSFELGDLTGWDIMPHGSLPAVQHQSPPYLPTDGDFLLASEVNTGDISFGTWFEQSFFAGAGDVLQFDWALEIAYGNGYAQVDLLRAGFNVIGLSIDFSTADWERVGWPITAADDYTLRFIATTAPDSSVRMLVDNVAINPVSSPTNPILPTIVVPTGPGEPPTFVFNDGLSGQWFDPPVAEGYTYQMTSGSLFTEILDFPTGFNQPFTVTVGDIVLGQFGPGESVDFSGFDGGGVESFQISGLDPGTDPDDPSAFPLKLLFNTDQASFTMQAIVVVPEPATWFLGLCGLSLLVGRLAVRNRHRSAVPRRTCRT